MTTRNQRRAQKLLARVIPFDQWRATCNPTPYQIDGYRRVVAALRELAGETGEPAQNDQPAAPHGEPGDGR